MRISKQKAQDLLDRIGKKDNFFFIQVGANDGKMVDPIREHILKYNWRGIMVEPIPDYFESLKKNYKGAKGLIFEQLAISSENSNPIKIYYLEKNNESEKVHEYWHFGLAGISFNDNEIWKKSKFSSVTTVPVKTVGYLQEKYNIPSLDLLQIDAEGMDYEVIKGIDFTKSAPRVINFEVNNLNNLSECKNFLRNHGYDLHRYAGDMIAIQKNLGITP